MHLTYNGLRRVRVKLLLKPIHSFTLARFACSGQSKLSKRVRDSKNLQNENLEFIK